MSNKTCWYTSQEQYETIIIQNRHLYHAIWHIYQTNEYIIYNKSLKIITIYLHY